MSAIITFQTLAVAKLISEMKQLRGTEFHNVKCFTQGKSLKQTFSCLVEKYMDWVRLPPPQIHKKKSFFYGLVEIVKSLFEGVL